ncbi:hypothetical protein KIPB_006226 [Kipferlia bialata]|uniref:Uncharacterized protein n=1 Tax=Kipferlia bialata TaxID=797122 RepID=A0A391NUF0_9EUKA|nr:hypothetical protein KIPB_003966 [Kipferlia bialata]GCA62858.1 hypothetical protein KIPB_006226 [Kipferlia bialata]|eukprot:g3966.t1
MLTPQVHTLNGRRIRSLAGHVVEPMVASLQVEEEGDPAAKEVTLPVEPWLSPADTHWSLPERVGERIEEQVSQSLLGINNVKSVFMRDQEDKKDESETQNEGQ